MPPLAAATLSIAMLAAFLLGGAGLRQLLVKKDPIARRRGLLMFVMALVLAGNVLIWTI
ncbi:hypothetical protein [Sphingomicrobium lutaoense]|uniref:Uncharacterized protein n=1 Tax=Sphingomicrobium lutaoense TaxID=515949 RepID=A0A839YZK4_9SPHN|nr:hypothetical protein [Sphingomicrobium lutaoense]MBB3763758.1 hypothetical protein [Sphingomicrobium lutaoense]